MKTAPFELAAALRLYESQHDQALMYLDRLTARRQTLEHAQAERRRELREHYEQIAGSEGLQGGDIRRYHAAAVAARGFEQSISAQLAALGRELTKKRTEIQELRRKVRMVEILRDKHDNRIRHELGREAEAEAAFLHLTRSQRHTGA